MEEGVDGFLILGCSGFALEVCGYILEWKVELEYLVFDFLGVAVAFFDAVVYLFCEVRPLVEWLGVGLLIGDDEALGFDLGNGGSVKRETAVCDRHTAQQREGILPRELLAKAVHEHTDWRFYKKKESKSRLGFSKLEVIFESGKRSFGEVINNYIKPPNRVVRGHDIVEKIDSKRKL